METMTVGQIRKGLENKPDSELAVILLHSSLDPGGRLIVVQRLLEITQEDKKILAFECHSANKDMTHGN